MQVETSTPDLANEELTLGQMLEKAVNLKTEADKFGAHCASIIMQNVPSIGGWDMRLTVAAPGILENPGDDEQ